MASIKKIYDDAAMTNQVYPQTHEKAVVDDNGTTLESKLGTIVDLVNQEQMEIGAVQSDLTPTKNSTNWVTSGGVFTQTDNLDKNLGGTKSFYFSDFEDIATGLYIGNTTYMSNSGYKTCVVGLDGRFGKITITSNTNDAIFAFMASYNTPANNASLGTFATGYSKRVVQTKNTTVTYDVPSDCNYIIVSYQKTSDTIFPTSIALRYGLTNTVDGILPVTEELKVFPQLYREFFDDLSLISGLSGTPSPTHSLSDGELTIGFTSSATQVLGTEPITGILLGQYYKFTVEIKKTSNSDGAISIGFTIGYQASEANKIFYPTTTMSTYTFILKAETYTRLYIGAHESYNKGETYVIDSLTIETVNTANDYVTETARKIARLENIVSPIVYDLQTHINSGGDVFIPAGTYTVDSLTIPNGTRLHGVAGATILKLTSGASNIISLDIDSADITIDGITFVGNAQITRSARTLTELRNRSDEGTECGIYVYRFAKRVLIHNCEFKNFSLAGIRLLETHINSFNWTFKITDCYFTGNWYGLLSDIRSEYHTIMGCSFDNNQIGAFVAGGNNTFSECRFEENGTGFVVSGTGGNNDSHGSVGTCSFNHNIGYGIAAIDINYGFNFTGCNVGDGTGIMISNSRGFCFVGGQVSCKIIIDSERSAGYNMFADNMFSLTSAYGTGTIEGNPVRLSLHGNRFYGQDDCSAINNNV